VVDESVDHRGGDYFVAEDHAPDGWTKTFTDPRLCAAIVDRLTFNATIIETGTEFYRLARARAGAGTSAA
jgi:IstB-like ATP binding protein